MEQIFDWHCPRCGYRVYAIDTRKQDFYMAVGEHTVACRTEMQSALEMFRSMFTEPDETLQATGLKTPNPGYYQYRPGFRVPTLGEELTDDDKKLLEGLRIRW